MTIHPCHAQYNQIVKNWPDVAYKVALAFPDIYDLGMSNLGLMILYDIVNKQMCVGLPKGKPKDLSLKPDENGILEVRMLVDWAQLEIFSAGGAFSASYQLGFEPDDSTVGLSSTGGEVKLVSLALNEIGSIWPEIKGQ